MEFKYRIKGRVEIGFIIRGHYFRYGEKIDLLVYPNELPVVKQMLSAVEVTELTNGESPLPVRNEPTPEQPKEVKKNVGRPKGTSNKQD